MRWDLEQPIWALMTVLIVAQPKSGMAMHKGLARLLGTLVGSTMSVVFMSYCAQAPWLFLISVAVWIGLCTGASTTLRSSFSYSFVLAGYTVAIIALPSISDPVKVFEQAVSRCTEISLGIVCTTAISLLVWPVRVGEDLSRQAGEAFELATTAVLNGISGRARASDGLVNSLSKIFAIDSQREHAWFEGSVGRNRGKAVGAFLLKLISLIRVSRSAGRLWRQMDEESASRLTPLSMEVNRTIELREENHLRDLLARILEMQQRNSEGLYERAWISRISLLLQEMLSSIRILENIRVGSAVRYNSEKLATHIDLASATLFGLRSSVAFLSMACFWMATEWSSAAGGMLLTCVVCGLFASSENGAQFGVKFLKGISLAVPTSLIVSQILLPQLSGYAMLCLAMGVPLFFGTLALANPKTGPVGLSFCLVFTVLTSVSNHMTFSVSSFLNTSVAVFLGVSAAVLAFKLLVFRYPSLRARQLRQSLRGDLQELTVRNLSGAEAWFGGRMADRLLTFSRISKDLSPAEQKALENDIYGLDIGDELLLLRFAIDRSAYANTGIESSYLAEISSVLNNPPELSSAQRLNFSTDDFFTRLDDLAEVGELPLIKTSAAQIRESWGQWCRTEEEKYGTA